MPQWADYATAQASHSHQLRMSLRGTTMPNGESHVDSESGTVARFARAVDQLEACAGFIEEGGGPKLRMAVVLLDSLADNFLFRRLQTHVMRSDDHGFSFIRRRRLNKRDLEA